MPKNAFYGLTLIKMIVARFVGTGNLLIRYSNGHNKQKQQFKKFGIIFYKTLFL